MPKPEPDHGGGRVPPKPPFVIAAAAGGGEHGEPSPRQYMLSAEDAAFLEELLLVFNDGSGAMSSFLLDIGGNIVVEAGTSCEASELVAALMAGSYAATRELAYVTGSEHHTSVFVRGMNSDQFCAALDDEMLLGAICEAESNLSVIEAAAVRTRHGYREFLTAFMKDQPQACAGDYEHSFVSTVPSENELILHDDIGPVLASMSPQLLVADLEKSIDFYTNELGFVLDFRYEDFYAGVARGGHCIHLKATNTPVPGREFRRQNGHVDITFAVAGIDALFAEIDCDAVEVVQALREMPYGREFYIADPDGNIIAFVETS